LGELFDGKADFPQIIFGYFISRCTGATEQLLPRDAMKILSFVF
jgi:hypothetical protein